LPESSLRDDSFEGFDDGVGDVEMLFTSRNGTFYGGPSGLSTEDWDKLYAELNEVWYKWVRRDWPERDSDDDRKAGLEEWRASMASGPDIYGWFTPFYRSRLSIDA